EPLAIYRLMRIADLADVMISRNRHDRDAERGQLGRAICCVGFLIGCIDRHVAGMYDEIWLMLRDPTGKWRPVRVEVLLARAEMRIGNLNNSDHDASALGRVSCRALGAQRSVARIECAAPRRAEWSL
ncbi:hypothetical protein, partial [Bradyrhizobium genomosp. III]|uniref:hypothetical protein n=1 Tax=Bradyrhizobium genomosp. III TaxID=2683271 RepID=UPI001FCBBC90